MAQNAPNSVDVTDIQFKLHDKHTVFSAAGNVLRSNINLLATAPSKGLIFVGTPNQAELKVIQHKNLVVIKETNEKLLVRHVSLKSPANNIAVSCDGAMLAVNYTENNSGFLAVYSVASFATANIQQLHTIRISPEDNVSALQLLWNPVLPSILAIVLDNGSMGMYNFNGPSYEFHSLDKQEQVKCASWSPKGKQIVAGFPNGKICQFKPDLKLARTIPCPPNVHLGPFDTIAIQWLSTYQFACVFVQLGEDMSPSLFIVNAPKTGQPVYINYYDICYSSTGPRAHQVFLTHIQPWNLLLIATSNSMEVGMLGTKEAGETPSWVQYTLLDEARIELPLTADKQDTFPIGFAIDTASSHQIVIAEKPIPVMPMVHVLSTHGLMVTFDFLNLVPNTPGICSPPPPLSDPSGLSQFVPLDEKSADAVIAQLPVYAAGAPTDLSFGIPSGATSTPAVKEKPTSIFAPTPAPTGSIFASPAVPAPAQTGSLFGGQQPSAFSFSGFGQKTDAAPQTGFGFGQKTDTPTASIGFGSAPKPQTVPVSAPKTSFGGFAPAQQPTAAVNQSHISKSEVTAPAVATTTPLYTVPPTFNPPAQQAVGQKPSGLNSKPSKSTIENAEIDDIVQQMITMQVKAFDMELDLLSSKSKQLLSTCGDMDAVKGYTRRLNDLQELQERANEREFEADVQTLRHSLNETFGMLLECKSKLEMYNNPDLAKISISSVNQINRRDLATLNSLIATNQAQLQFVQQQIDAQWSNYQDLVNKNARTKMHIPSLEGIYQTLNKEKDILSRQRTKLNYIKSKLSASGLLVKTSQLNGNVNIESLADSILSMSLSHAVEENKTQLSESKTKALKNMLFNRKIAIIRAQRPERVGLKSEVILETKIRTEKQTRDGAVANVKKMEEQRIKNEQTVLTKPTPTKPVAQSAIKSIPPAVAPVGITFGGTSPFIKTSAAATSKAEETKSAVPSPFTGFSALSSSAVGNTLSFGASSKPSEAPKPQIAFGSPAATKPAEPSEKPSFSFAPATQPNKPLQFGGGSLFGGPQLSSESGKPSISFGTPKTDSTSSKPSLLFGSSEKPSISFGTPKQEVTALSFGSSEKPSISFGTPIGKPTISFGATKVEPEKSAAAPIGATSTANIAAKPTISFGAALESSTFGSKTTTTDSEKPSISFGTTPSMFGIPKEDVAKPADVEKPISLAKPEPISFSPKVLTTTDDVKSSSTKPSTESNATEKENITTKPATSSFLPSFTSFGIASEPSKSAFEAKTTTPVSTPASSGFSFGALSLASTAATTTTTPSAFGFSFGSSASTTAASSSTPSIFGGFSKSTLDTTTAPSVETTTTASVETTTTASVETTTTVAISTPLISANSATATISTISLADATVPASSEPVTSTANADPTDSLFGSLNICKPTSAVASTDSSSAPSGIFSSALLNSAATSNTDTDTKSNFGGTTSSAPAVVATTTPAAATSIFASSSSASITTQSTGIAFSFVSSASSATPLFGTSTAAATSSPSIFGQSAPSSTVSMFGSTSLAQSIFGNAIASTASSPFGAPASSSIFGTATSTQDTPTVASGGSIFGGIPKPDQSVFGNTAPVAAPFGSSGGPFGSPSSQPAPSGNIFGGFSSAAATNTTPGGSIFGGAGAGNAQGFSAASGGSVFGSPTQSNPTSGGSLFGQSFGQSGQQTGGSIFGNSSAGGGSMFGGTAAASSSPAQSSIFGSANQTPQQPSSPFGGSSAGGFGSGQSTGFGSGFGQPSGFGSPSQFGSFAQGGPSIAQTGFGSPQAQPVFGGTPTFGSPQPFGGTPSFGGAATFGVPKGMGGSSIFGGSVAQTAASPSFASPPPKNNLFEALGSTDSGLSFGNLAQSNANAQKPAFGGSAFMNYRG